MRPFAYLRADSLDAAIRGPEAASPSGATEDAETQYLAGGTTLIDLIKLDVMRPQRVVDINRLAQGRLAAIEADTVGLRLGALVRMAEAAEHPAVQRDYPAIAQSLLLAASPQLRNMASLGGNVLQRTRCPYFRDVSWAACNKRVPQSGCAAMDSFNRMHAVLGTSDHCIAAYPGDFAQALVALDARVDISGPDGDRVMPVSALFPLPGDTPHIEHDLTPNELITGFVVPAAPWTRRSLYLKVRDRQSYDFALASAAVALDLQDGVVQEARVALGGVATIPWRAPEAERALVGRRLDAATAAQAAEAAFHEARPRAHNAYKIPLGKRTLIRALLRAADLEVPA